MKDKKSTYERYRLKAAKLDRIASFMRNASHTVDTMFIDGKRYRLSKLQDGSISIERTAWRGVDAGED